MASIRVFPSSTLFTADGTAGGGIGILNPFMFKIGSKGTVVEVMGPHRFFSGQPLSWPMAIRFLMSQTHLGGGRAQEPWSPRGISPQGLS